MASNKRRREQCENVKGLIDTIKQSPDSDQFIEEVDYLSRILHCLKRESYSVRNKLCKVLTPIEDLFDEFTEVRNISKRRWALDELLREVSYAINNGLGLSPKIVRMIEGQDSDDHND